MNLEDIIKVLGGGSIFAVVSALLQWKFKSREEKRAERTAKHAIDIDWYDRAKKEVLALEAEKKQILSEVKELRQKNDILEEQTDKQREEVKRLTAVIAELEEEIEELNRQIMEHR